MSNAQAAQQVMRFMPAALLRVGLRLLSRLCCSHEGGSEAGAEAQGFKFVLGRMCFACACACGPDVVQGKGAGSRSEL